MPDTISDKDLKDIQGFILRGYHMDHVCHFIMEVQDPARAKAFLGRIADSITGAEEWNADKKPQNCLNIGFTFKGLEKLGLQEECDYLRQDWRFEPFVKGAVEQAKEIGDENEGAPDNWVPELREPNKVHMLLFLHARNKILLQQIAKELEGEFNKASILAHTREGDALPGERIHFGYRDGIAQPIIEGVPHRNRQRGLRIQEDGKQPDSPLGAFVLGHPSQWTDYKYPVPTPEDFGFNGSFAAYRILQQHVDRFEDCLKNEARKTGLSRELIAAKICGRWRNGTPLVLSPQFDYAVDEQMLNDFDYIDDTMGYRCPFGAHIRRTNPRDDEIAANVGSKHRIIRRGMPYGPPYDPQAPYDGHERGLLGLFICVNLRDQFEFIMKNWINQGGFHGRLPVDVNDPLMGPGYLPIPGPSGTTTIQLSQFITTRGGAYCFLPSKTGVKYIAAHS